MSFSENIEKLRRAAEAPLAQGCGALAVGTVASVYISMRPHDVRWLLGLPWACAIIVSWEFARVLTSNKRKKIASAVLTSMLAGVLCIWIYAKLAPIPDAIPQVTHSPSSPTAQDIAKTIIALTPKKSEAVLSARLAQLSSIISFINHDEWGLVTLFDLQDMLNNDQLFCRRSEDKASLSKKENEKLDAFLKEGSLVLFTQDIRSGILGLKGGGRWAGLIVSKKYQESAAQLSAFIDSPTTPTEVRSALIPLRDAVSSSPETIMRAINRGYDKNAQIYPPEKDPKMRRYLIIQTTWATTRTKLRPIVVNILSVINNFIQFAQ